VSAGILGYNLDEPLPDHSSLTRIRMRYGVEIFRQFFEAIVAQCQQAGLIWGKELYFDATQVQADAALVSLTARFAVEARQQARTARQAEEPYAQGKSAEGVQERQQLLEAHLAALFAASGVEPGDSASVSTPAPMPAAFPLHLPDALREEVEAANAARHDWIARAGQQRREIRGV